MRFYSMAHPFLNLERRAIVTTTTDLEVAAVAANKDGWTAAPITDPCIDPGIKYFDTKYSTCLIIRSHILSTRFLLLNMIGKLRLSD